MLIVQKFGGSSVGSVERMRAVAGIVRSFVERGDHIVVVASAMGGETDRLLKLSQGFQAQDPRELDVLLSSGEQASVALLCLALKEIGVAAQSFLAPQVPIVTNDRFTDAAPEDVNPSRLQECLARGVVPVVAGFQGVTREGALTTLGRGGSDATAILLASALKADGCQIYTDVRGVHTADPRILKEARKLPRIHAEEMLELSLGGSKVMQSRAMQLCSALGVPIEVLSSFDLSEGNGTRIDFDSSSKVLALASRAEEGSVSLVGRLLTSEIAEQALELLKSQGIPAQRTQPHPIRLAFLLPREDIPKALRVLHEALNLEKVALARRAS